MAKLTENEQKQLKKNFNKFRRLLRADVLAKLKLKNPNLYEKYLNSDKNEKIRIFTEFKAEYIATNKTITKAYNTSLNYLKKGKIDRLDTLIQNKKVKAKAKKAKPKQVKKTKAQKLLTKTFNQLRRKLRQDILVKFAQDSPGLYSLYIKADRKGKIQVFKELKDRYLMPNNQPYSKAYTSSLNYLKKGSIASLNKMIQNATIEGATSYLIDAVKIAVEKHAPELTHKLELLDELSVSMLQHIYDKLVRILNAYKNGDYGAIFDLVEELFESLEDMT